MKVQLNFVVGIWLVVVATILVDSITLAFVVPLQPAILNPQQHTQSSTLQLFMSIPNPIDTALSGLVSICRLPRGVTVLEGKTIHDLPESERPTIKVLYDIENSKECRKVRELITELDFVVEAVVPAGPNSKVFTNPDYQYALEPNTEIPRIVLIDNDTEQTIVGADNIIAYFNQKFQLQDDTTDDDDVTAKIINVLREVGGYIAPIFRLGRGIDVAKTAIGAPRPTERLILYSYEGNQFCRLVREVLTELDIVYELRSAGKGSIRRNELATRTGGSTQCPYLVDPNSNVEIPESKDIILYLYATYGRWVPPNELLQWTSNNIMSLAKPIFTTLTPLQAGASSSDESSSYQTALAKAKDEIATEIASTPIVVYTYSLSPFSSETKAVLDNMGLVYKEISLGAEWIPGLIAENGAIKRAALLELTGQSSLPHIFVGGNSIGGLFSGTPGLIPALEQNIFQPMVQDAMGIDPSKPPRSSSQMISFQ